MYLAGQTAETLLPLLESRQASNEEIVRSVLSQIADREPEVRAFLAIRDERELIAEAVAVDERRRRGEAVGPLQGLLVAVKDNFCTQGLRTTCGSRMLETFVPPYDATAVARTRKADGIVLGKTNMDEFAMGSTTERSAFQLTRNPHHPDYVPGGTSGGSAAALAANETILALGSDTGGSIRQPASFCGVVGLKPTYGRVSRYGLVAHASSFDQPGPLGKSVYDAALLLSVIAGQDPFDATSTEQPTALYHQHLHLDHPLRIGVPWHLMEEGLDPEVKQGIESVLRLLKDDGHTIVDVELTHSRYALASYYILVCSEASANLARYDGVKYGHRSKSAATLRDMYRNSRSEGFGPEVKRRIMLGTFALSSGYYDAYYEKAMRVRSLLKQDFDAAFTECDFILHPVSPIPPFRLGEKIDDPLAMYLADIYSVLANLVGSPAISIPTGKTTLGLPLGVQLTGKHFEEQHLLAAARRVETLAHAGAAVEG